MTGNSIGILQGSRVLFADYETGGPMWTGSGNRESRFHVVFSERFLGPPAVIIGLSLLDMSNETNIRADIAAENITEKEFQIVFRTWSDSRVARIRADWTAIGPVRDADDWDID